MTRAPKRPSQTRRAMHVRMSTYVGALPQGGRAASLERLDRPCVPRGLRFRQNARRRQRNPRARRIRHDARRVALVSASGVVALTHGVLTLRSRVSANQSGLEIEESNE
jgi:hypothetical protein